MGRSSRRPRPPAELRIYILIHSMVAHHANPRDSVRPTKAAHHRTFMTAMNLRPSVCVVFSRILSCSGDTFLSAICLFSACRACPVTPPPPPTTRVSATPQRASPGRQEGAGGDTP
jgi:hypothetical protein